uniref:Uncharacterized protein n=2 Tax=Kalanchoe fedtschenkoi TaxID=63787 RepID=A0A7N0TIV5_KALFE
MSAVSLHLINLNKCFCCVSETNKKISLFCSFSSWVFCQESAADSCSKFYCASMAQLLSPVCTEAIKFRIPLFKSCSVSRCSVFPNSSGGRMVSGQADDGGRRKRGFGKLRVATDDPVSSSAAVVDDYYAVLGLLPDATPEQIKKAYYNCMKACHPDLSGNDADTTNFCMFINDVYEVLSDPVQRMVYDEIHGYALTAINPFCDDSAPRDHAFVDEFSCIGCKNCANLAPDVFGIEEDFGRARVHRQCGNPDLVQQAIDSCPVDCIHWASFAQLSLLEDEMRRMERVNVALMLTGMGVSADVFRMAYSRWEKRQSKVLEQAKAKMMQQKGSDDPYWSNVWGRPKDRPSTEEEVKERANRAAAAARRWREYSRKGADKRPAFKLTDAMSNKDN